MKALLNRVDRTLHRTGTLGGWVSNSVLGGVALLTVVDICLRYGFDRPFYFTMEVTEFGLCIAIYLAIVNCTASRGHVTIDILMVKFPRRGRAALNSLYYLIAAGLFGLLVWRFIVYALQSQSIGQVSMMLKLPYLPFILFSAFCSLLISLLFLSQVIHFVAEAVRK